MIPGNVLYSCYESFFSDLYMQEFDPHKTGQSLQTFCLRLYFVLLCSLVRAFFMLLIPFGGERPDENSLYRLCGL